MYVLVNVTSYITHKLIPLALNVFSLQGLLLYVKLGKMENHLLHVDLEHSFNLLHKEGPGVGLEKHIWDGLRSRKLYISQSKLYMYHIVGTANLDLPFVGDTATSYHH